MQTLKELAVEKVENFPDGERRFVVEDGIKLAVFRVGDKYYAYENRCMHQGGPVCEGKILGKVEAVLEEDKNVVREKMSDSIYHLVCPWHGYEYNLRTGEAAGDARIRLNRFEVVEKEGMIYVLV